MVWLKAAGIGALVVLLFLVQRFFPRRGIFAIFCLVLLGAGAVLFMTQEEKTAPMTAAERDHISEQQGMVVDWYTEYQGLIDQMDHNWQQYHRILSDFDADVIDLTTAWERLDELDGAALSTLDALMRMEPPLALDDENYDLVTTIILKARAYATEQRQTIRHTADVADPEKQLTEVQEEQSRRLRDVMRSEAPAGLFTAKEISALRDNVDTRD
ncbi:MAG: hypothetical protein IJ631_05135 [Schwartzia sp.]|nr:hypothetical protein [Schwartzia sp. (in: firmicutes)]MBR1553377.1 hypothetical protein [Schwartzia sp. (in: firmicutes)]